MGVIRGFFLVIATVLLFLSLISMTLFWTLGSSLSYNNVEKQSVIIIKDFLQDTNVTDHIQKVYPIIQLYCQNYSNYVFSLEGYTVDIPCDVALQGDDAVIEEGIKDMVHEIYYTEYDCDFLNCFNEMYIDSKGKVTPFFLISEKAYDFWNNKFHISLIASLVLLALVFLLIEKKTTMPLLIGSLLIISSLPFIKLDVLLSLFSDKTSVKLLSIFFSQAYFIAVKILIAGIILLAIGIILKIFKVGFSISDFISKIKEKIQEGREKQKQQKMQVQKKSKKARKSKSK